MRRLIDFWIVLFVVGFAFVGLLHSIGPPGRPPPQAASAVPQAGSVRSSSGPIRDGRIAAPDPALIEASQIVPGASLPRVGADGRTPMRVYARPFDTTDPRPRIGLLVAGVGVLEAESRAAIERLPGPVSLAVSAYGQRLESLLDAARDNGHELLASIPMESAGFPLNDAGARSLLTGASPEANQRTLEAVLSRFAGYIGATGASDGMRGERFAASAGFSRVAGELSRRGLLYIDPRPSAQDAAPIDVPGEAALRFRAVDVVIDEPASRAEVEAKLALLEWIARDRGSALGLASALRPATIDRLAAWAATVEARGLVLAPVSALVPDPTLSGQR